MLPEILANDDLQAGNALALVSIQATMLVGSALAGVIVATLRSGPALAIDALTFVASAISLALMRDVFLTGGQAEQQVPGKETETLTTASPTELISLGRFLRTSRLFRVTFLFVIISNFCFGGLAEVALPALANGLLAVGANGYGLILMAIGAGALTGSVFAGTMNKMPHKGLIGLLVSLIQALALMLIPHGGLAGTITLVLIAGAVSSFAYTLLMTVIQLNLPRHLMGRIMGIFLFASFGSFPISTVLAGVLITHFGPAILFPFSGFALILAIFLSLIQKGLREL
jgi:predicted MFS family arabinose efflux permease